ncbi:MAG: ABC transporter ATP-binding protein [Lactobacillales bacterium]|jgi:ABC-2 type transport system ATP-binding protein|nr:ABC transporter ATP-binding protein [Lactobacillales bacterium]
MSDKPSISISAQNISRAFPGDIQALDDVSMTFKSGVLYGLIGPAGAGKTTLLRIILSLLNKDNGTIEYTENGNRVSFEDFRSNIAYMPEQQSLYADLSVEEHLDFFRDLYGIAPAEYKKKRAELLEMTRLEKFVDRPAGQLSGGMYKKLGLMCALLRSPKVMLLDEPTNGVDPISRREFWEMLHTSVNQGILIIMTTAYMDEAERCGFVYLLETGKMIGCGEPMLLLNKEKVKGFDDLFLKGAGEKIK